MSNYYLTLRGRWIEYFAWAWKQAEKSAIDHKHPDILKSWGMDDAIADEYALSQGIDTGSKDTEIEPRLATKLFYWPVEIKNSQIIMFPGEQAQVFAGLDYFPFLPDEYHLPFSRVFLQFSEPVLFASAENGEEVRLAAIFVSRHLLGDHTYERIVVFEDPTPEGHKELRKAAMKWAQKPLPGNYNPSFWLLNENGQKRVIIGRNWGSSFIDEESDFFRRMTNACIGYINCENVYLHKDGIVDEAVNRKRERKGKARLEPYYVCRIHGVNYDSHVTGTGTAHGHRYDVRGHFRRLDSGKVTWVRPHQRGLKNELYIPKVYEVDKKVESPQ